MQLCRIDDISPWLFVVSFSILVAMLLPVDGDFAVGVNEKDQYCPTYCRVIRRKGCAIACCMRSNIIILKRVRIMSEGWHGVTFGVVLDVHSHIGMSILPLQSCSCCVVVANASPNQYANSQTIHFHNAVLHYADITHAHSHQRSSGRIWITIWSGQCASLEALFHIVTQAFRDHRWIVFQDGSIMASKPGDGSGTMSPWINAMVRFVSNLASLRLPYNFWSCIDSSFWKPHLKVIIVRLNDDYNKINDLPSVFLIC